MHSTTLSLAKWENKLHNISRIYTHTHILSEDRRRDRIRNTQIGNSKNSKAEDFCPRLGTNPTSGRRSFLSSRNWYQNFLLGDRFLGQSWDFKNRYFLDPQCCLSEAQHKTQIYTHNTLIAQH